ncbi:TPA: hypothetical protein ACKFSO_005252, partial [Klebsiella pneumoniae]|uniref:hypothetical protein n=2 Tax=Pseudomonadota TaxID=1224 RepID=UPI00003D8ADF
KNNAGGAYPGHDKRAYAARPKVGVERRAIKDAGSRTCIEKVAPFDRKPFDGQTGAKSSAREIR